MDFSIKQVRLPQEDRTQTIKQPASKVGSVGSTSQQAKWHGMDRRRSADRRRSRRGFPPIVELRQRNDRRKSLAISISV